jgi:hypothetical protein
MPASADRNPPIRSQSSGQASRAHCNTSRPNPPAPTIKIRRTCGGKAPGRPAVALAIALSARTPFPWVTVVFPICAELLKSTALGDGKARGAASEQPLAVCPTFRKGRWGGLSGIQLGVRPGGASVRPRRAKPGRPAICLEILEPLPILDVSSRPAGQAVYLFRGKSRDQTHVADSPLVLPRGRPRRPGPRTGLVEAGCSP